MIKTEHHALKIISCLRLFKPIVAQYFQTPTCMTTRAVLILRALKRALWLARYNCRRSMKLDLNLVPGIWLDCESAGFVRKGEPFKNRWEKKKSVQIRFVVLGLMENINGIETSRNSHKISLLLGSYQWSLARSFIFFKTFGPKHHWCPIPFLYQPLAHGKRCSSSWWLVGQRQRSNSFGDPSS